MKLHLLEESKMKPENIEAIGAAVTRLALGVVLIAHSIYLKFVVFTLPGTAQFFASIGLPSTLAYVVFAIEDRLAIENRRACRCTSFAWRYLGALERRLAIHQLGWWLGVSGAAEHPCHCAGLPW
jgi:putative oxidoreductase